MYFGNSIITAKRAFAASQTKGATIKIIVIFHKIIETSL